MSSWPQETSRSMFLLAAPLLKKAMNVLDAHLSTNQLPGVVALTKDWIHHIIRVVVSQSWRLLCFKRQ
jgi:hypothetical protein